MSTSISYRPLSLSCLCLYNTLQEIFGPVLTVYVYPDNQAEEMLHVVNDTSLYGLTGAVFSNDRLVCEGRRGEVGKGGR